ncbi:hypothetical protein G7Y89_g8865 [Cudoniella acicularis]|uniref:Heterokaryon incompatibility domain-containing protein n=1 Tax=Cudoniella acicularis TaxID=354080 RepID=A0A8H4RFT0_9HELO|nr:hypothetical protein G7Y89_g8865 [Cudoniella acicularis]
MAPGPCHVCRSLDLEKLATSEPTETQKHHASYIELKECVRSTGCELCTLISQDLKEGMKKVDEKFHYDSIACWGECPQRYVETWYGFCDVCFALRYNTPTGYGSTSSWVQFFVPRESELALRRLISGRPVALQASDESCFELAKKWRDTCLERHGESCSAPIKALLPSRVIDVGPPDGSKEPRLKETGCASGCYVALSHCWGTTASFVTNRQNLEERKRMVRTEEMPKSFSDAVTVVRRLGYQYLWIDSLCIIQGDKDDWVAESVCMGDYYKNAIITISTDSASGDHEGFLEYVRDNSGDSVLTLTSGERIGFRPQRICPKFRDGDTCVSRRAWTLQEFILSPRSLLYSAGQLVWECQRRKYCEADDNSQLDQHDLSTKHFFSPPLKAEELEQIITYPPRARWYNLVSDGFIREITVSSDRFPAISGLAREVQRMAPGQYAAGIWLEDFHRGLLWETGGAGKTMTTYRAPSWSWAALDFIAEAASYHLLIYKRMGSLPEMDITESRAMLLDHHVELVDNDPFGRVSGGSITIRGKFISAREWRGVDQLYFQSFHSEQEGYFDLRQLPDKKDQIICSFDLEDGEPDARIQDVLLLQLSAYKSYRNGKTASLALLLSIDGKDGIETYRRIGIAEIPHIDGLADNGWEMKDVCII